MNWTKDTILEILDRCAEEFVFPVLDNGYVYFAATKMALYRSEQDWAIVIEVFGFSPRFGQPDTHIYTFSSKLHDRDPASNYVSEEAYRNYLDSNPFNESRFVYPIENSDWKDKDDTDYVRAGGECVLRGNKIDIPENSSFRKLGIELEKQRPLVFEFCRYLEEKYTDQVFCTQAERRISISPELTLLLQLDAWNHPDISGGERPSSSETFQQIAKVIVTGNTQCYQPTQNKNTHWKNWLESGEL
jgi:hypothetical protein